MNPNLTSLMCAALSDFNTKVGSEKNTDHGGHFYDEVNSNRLRLKGFCHDMSFGQCKMPCETVRLILCSNKKMFKDVSAVAWSKFEPTVKAVLFPKEVEAELYPIIEKKAYIEFENWDKTMVIPDNIDYDNLSLLKKLNRIQRITQGECRKKCGGQTFFQKFTKSTGAGPPVG
uniref:Uncharacterized protein n=1 Tax=Rhabditophanes sp. KR3021 TaxID=114890 RepID=A0AC35TT40_9BILA